MKNTDYEQLQAAYERLHNDYSYLFSQYHILKSNYGIEKARAEELELLALKKDMKIWEMQLEISKLK